ncbi:MAG: helix-turn-helix domain-containing protein [Solirubrobacteraceae bacterium]
MAAVPAPAPIGDLLRSWRHRRSLSQLELSLDAAISSRHLSFVETGRARPSREMLLYLAEHLEVPLRERNGLLLAAGYAPVYRERSLQTPEMASVRQALDRFLRAHEPFPAIVIDRRHELLAANDALHVLTDGVAPELLQAPANALRVALHPDGMARAIVNFGEWSAHLMGQLRREASATGDPAGHV